MTQAKLVLLAFRLGTQQYALSIDVVVEVASMVALTTVPNAPPALMGIASRHGEVLPVLDLRQVIGLPPHTVTANSLFIVVELRGQRVGLVVDEVYQVKYWQWERVHLAQGAGPYIQYIVSEGSDVLQIMALEPLLVTALPNQFAKS